MKSCKKHYTQIRGKWDKRKGKEKSLPIFFYLIPNNFPILFRRPLFVVGIPVIFAIFLFAFVTPNARFQLKDKPGIADFFFAMLYPPFFF